MSHGKYNQCITSLGTPLLRRFTNALPNNVVSVGSGNGSLEKEIFGDQVICVDPTPFSFQKEMAISEMHLPDYPRVTDLLADKPELKGNCSLFLNWPTPNDIAPYDYEAIQLLNPNCVLTCVETTGSAGSSHFLSSIQHFEDLDIFVPRFASKPPLDNYEVHAATTQRERKLSVLGPDNFDYMYLLLKRTDFEMDPIDVPRNLGTKDLLPDKNPNGDLMSMVRTLLMMEELLKHAR